MTAPRYSAFLTGNNYIFVIQYNIFSTSCKIEHGFTENFNIFSEELPEVFSSLEGIAS